MTKKPPKIPVSRIPRCITITEASRFFKKDIKTIRKRIIGVEAEYQEGLNVFYPFRQLAEAVVMGNTDLEKSDLNLTQEKAHYYRELTEKVRVEKERIAGNLLDADEIEKEQVRIRLAFRDKLLAVSERLARAFARLKCPDAIKEKLDEAHHDVLLELGGDPDQPA